MTVARTEGDETFTPSHAPSHMTLLLGGVRSGKSARAVSLAMASAGRVLFAATAQAFDEDMTARIEAHRRERPAAWHTIESPVDLPADLARALHETDEPYTSIVIDCITVWVGNILLALADTDDAEAIVAARIGQFLAVREAARRTAVRGGPPMVPPERWIVVSNEVGLGVVPPTPLGRRYRDALGRANQLLAAAADEVTLLVAGLELPLRRSGPA
jgi:adenosyl cobinamide kinase/adenosyl cobinamide phosphate guanylyltransferase